MSINTAHASNGVLLHASEYLLLFTDCVIMEITGERIVPFFGLKYGRLYLTSHRMIFMSKRSDTWLQSASFPYVAMSDVKLTQVLFLEEYYVQGKVKPQPNGHFHNEICFKVQFEKGGENVFEEFLNWCIKSAKQNQAEKGIEELPPYEPCGGWFELKDIDYEPPELLLDIIPKHPSFYDPPPNTIFASGCIPPFVGIIDPGYRGPRNRPCHIEPPICCRKIVPPSRKDLFKEPTFKKVLKPGCTHLLPVCTPIKRDKPLMEDFAQQYNTTYYRLLAGSDSYQEKFSQPEKEQELIDWDELFKKAIDRQPTRISKVTQAILSESDDTSLNEIHPRRSMKFSQTTETTPSVSSV